jgi:hypothetical protein
MAFSVSVLGLIGARRHGRVHDNKPEAPGRLVYLQLIRRRCT